MISRRSAGSPGGVDQACFASLDSIRSSGSGNGVKCSHEGATIEVDRALSVIASYPANRTRVVLRLASCASVLLYSVLSENWEPPDEVLSWVILSPEGAELERRISGELPSAKPADVRLGVFIAFVSSSAFLIDDGATAVDAITTWLSNALRAREVNVPWVFAPELVAAYASTVGRFTTELSPTETQTLLAALPQGFSQLGEYVAGPLGLLTAESRRRILPTHSIRAFECDRPGCDRDHQVVLTQGSTMTAEVFNLISAQWQTLPAGAASCCGCCLSLQGM